MDGTLSNEVRFRAKVNDRVPPHELLVWADEIERLERIAGYAAKYARGDENAYLSVLQQLAIPEEAP